MKIPVPTEKSLDGLTGDALAAAWNHNFQVAMAAHEQASADIQTRTIGQLRAICLAQGGMIESEDVRIDGGDSYHIIRASKDGVYVWHEVSPAGTIRTGRIDQ